MALNVKKLKKIRKFGRLRFTNDPRYKEKTMFVIYEKANEERRKLFDKEMDDYIQAVESGKIKAGESLLKIPFVEDKNPETKQE